MEQKDTQEKMIAEYRTWFAIFLKCLSEIKVDAQNIPRNAGTN